MSYIHAFLDGALAASAAFALALAVSIVPGGGIAAALRFAATPFKLPWRLLAALLLVGGFCMRDVFPPGDAAGSAWRTTLTTRLVVSSLRFDLSIGIGAAPARSPSATVTIKRSPVHRYAVALPLLRPVRPVRPNAAEPV
ncbi:hypothetical protein SNE35_20355 [Paucibacter sp. R3-3]|uniref:Uncharacterized protein n=1 Tax=Roseateles agri TaxID=3098619 RepID=A0ABU5DKN9_9BURK|nr:hypothetical protein [Paucibacter sp. R3-3]MDY0746876.1 hypothetical protein [Paucibacter sp. R3-3]